MKPLANIAIKNQNDIELMKKEQIRSRVGMEEIKQELCGIKGSNNRLQVSIEESINDLAELIKGNKKPPSMECKIAITKTGTFDSKDHLDNRHTRRRRQTHV